jgi:ATP-binding cassette subfamily A (ABC1) protein 3
MPEIRKSMGVCPQHDVLFPELTVIEHLKMFGRIKGLIGAELTAAVNTKIEQVGLTEKINTPSKALSGGMKRKLSLAIALIGDSKIVFLDEPTSGMDPYSRRFTWEMLKQNKEGRVIVLTTHFMVRVSAVTLQILEIRIYIYFFKLMSNFKEILKTQNFTYD